MINLYLVRHGESTINTWANEIEQQPDHAVSLTERGMQQANKAGEFLLEYLKNQGAESSDVAFWVSPFNRTRQTANLILNTMHPHIVPRSVKEDALLTEMQFGLFNSIPKAKLPLLFPREYETYTIARKFNGKFYARRPGGESPFDCEIRQRLWLETFYRDINAGDHPQHVVLVGHGAQTTLLRKAIFHLSHEWYAKEPNPGNCSIQLIKLSPKNNTWEGYIYGEPEEEH